MLKVLIRFRRRVEVTPYCGTIEMIQCIDKKSSLSAEYIRLNACYRQFYKSDIGCRSVFVPLTKLTPYILYDYWTI